MTIDEAVIYLEVQRDSIKSLPEEFCLPYKINLAKALDVAIEALKEKKDFGWISVEERLPDMDGEYVVKVDGKTKPFVYENPDICKAEINAIPAADVDPVRHGRWIDAYPDIEPNPMFMYGICSECGFEQGISKYLNYCHNCGAKMDTK